MYLPTFSRLENQEMISTYMTLHISLVGSKRKQSVIGQVKAEVIYPCKYIEILRRGENCHISGELVQETENLWENDSLLCHWEMRSFCPWKTELVLSLGALMGSWWICSSLLFLIQQFLLQASHSFWALALYGSS